MFQRRFLQWGKRADREGEWGVLRERHAEGLREKEGVRAVPRAAERFQ
jgi:hypothetical protein